MDNKEQCRKLANRIYELDEKVYKTSGSGLGKTFTGEKARVLDDLTMLIVSNPQGHLLRSELALIGNMARSIRNKEARHDLLVEYNDILEEIANLPMSFGSVDIVDKDLANICIYLFFGLLAVVLLFGGETRYIIETGLSSLGTMVQNFIGLSTFTDPLRTSNFPQNWTIYYWAYWMVWCVAAPFFIGSISRGRTVRQTILGGYGFGVGSTLISFIILGNYSMGMQVTGKADFIAQYLKDGDLYGMIVSMIKTMPCAPVIMVIVLLTMVAFYATSFDSIALTASCYSYRKLEEGEQPHRGIQLMWCLLLIALPIALLFAESSMSNLQSVSIVAAFPIGVVILLITGSFLKDAKKYIKENK